ncbi:MAG: hypothetical protein WC515_01185 [Candidatus Omnitrophota bacterium]
MATKKKAKKRTPKKTVVKKRVKKTKGQGSRVRKAKGQRSRVKKTKKPALTGPEATMEKVGEVTHYFPHVKAAAVLLLKDGLRVGDEIYLKGHTTDFKEKVLSIQLDHVSIEEGRKSQEIGLLVRSRVRIGDSVYRV